MRDLHRAPRTSAVLFFPHGLFWELAALVAPDHQWPVAGPAIVLVAWILSTLGLTVWCGILAFVLLRTGFFELPELRLR
jgi:hypothetical protein